MISKLFIPVAAFAVTVTGAAAFGNADWSELSIDLSDAEIAALEEADTIRQTAHDEAKAVLEGAGIDEDRMQEIREEMREARRASHEAMHTALEAGDYDAFMEAIADSPLAEHITSEADFETFQEAHQLRQDGNFEEAETRMAELGIERPEGGRHGHKGFGGPERDGARQSAETE